MLSRVGACTCNVDTHCKYHHRKYDGWSQFYQNFIGYLSGNGSLIRQLCWCIHGLASSYLAACCQPTSHCAGVTGGSNLRSANIHQLHVPRTRTCYGDRSFLVNGPAAWNRLPVALRLPDTSLDIFKDKLKTFLFRTVCWMRICGLREFARYKSPYYYYTRPAG